MFGEVRKLLIIARKTVLANTDNDAQRDILARTSQIENRFESIFKFDDLEGLEIVGGELAGKSLSRAKKKYR